MARLHNAQRHNAQRRNAQRRNAQRRDREGSEAVEFSLIFALIFVPMLMGIIDLGWLFYQRSALNQAITLGCREASLLDNTDQGDIAYATELVTLGVEEALRLGAANACDDGCDIEVSFGAIGIDLDDDGTDDRTLSTVDCRLTTTIQPLLGFAIDESSHSTLIVGRLEWQ